MTEYYHIIDPEMTCRPSYYVEGKKDKDGNIWAKKYCVVRVVREGKRVSARTIVHQGGLFKPSCKIRKLKKNPFKN